MNDRQPEGHATTPRLMAGLKRQMVLEWQIMDDEGIRFFDLIVVALLALAVAAIVGIALEGY